MATERKSEPKLTEATAKTTAVLQTLQSRLNREPSRVDTSDELGEELQHYFATSSAEPLPKISNEIRDLVIEGVVARILRSWEESDRQPLASIKSKVVERLVERVLADLLKNGSGPAGPSARR